MHGSTRLRRRSRVLRVVGMVRYRFFLYAGLLPYLLGAAWAHAIAGSFDAALFWSGLFGVVLAVIGVEAFNEYFDSRMGTDRVFNPDGPAADVGRGLLARRRVRSRRARRGRVSDGSRRLARSSCSRCWAARQRSSTWRRRSGGRIAGSAKLVIALAYGPWIVLGSLYLHTGAVSWGAFWASLVPGCLIMALAVVNAIPDFHQDRLVGKRNLVVRIGRRHAVSLYLGLAAAALVVVVSGVVARLFPLGCLGALQRSRCSSRARGAPPERTSASPVSPAVRSIVACYAVAVGLFTSGSSCASPAEAPCPRNGSIRSAHRCSCRGRSRATAISAACIAVPNPHRASALMTSSTQMKPCASWTTWCATTFRT